MLPASHITAHTRQRVRAYSYCMVKHAVCSVTVDFGTIDDTQRLRGSFHGDGSTRSQLPGANSPAFLALLMPDCEINHSQSSFYTDCRQAQFHWLQATYILSLLIFLQIPDASGLGRPAAFWDFWLLLMPKITVAPARYVNNMGSSTDRSPRLVL